jgi:hypothetical protein
VSQPLAGTSHGKCETVTRTFSGQSKYRDTVGSRTAYGQNADIRGAGTVTDMDYTRTNCGRGCGHGLDADAPGCGLDTAPDRTRTARDYGHQHGHLAGQIADSPRLFRGRKNLVLTRSKACV